MRKSPKCLIYCDVLLFCLSERYRIRLQPLRTRSTTRSARCHTDGVKNKNEINLLLGHVLCRVLWCIISCLIWIFIEGRPHHSGLCFSLFWSAVFQRRERTLTAGCILCTTQLAPRSGRILALKGQDLMISGVLGFFCIHIMMLKPEYHSYSFVLSTSVWIAPLCLALH